MPRRTVWWWSRKGVGAVLAFLGLAGALGMPQDVFTWLRCVSFRGCGLIVASMPQLPDFDPARATGVVLGLIGVALLSPLPEHLGQLLVTQRRAPAQQDFDVRARLWLLDHPSVGNIRLRELERQLEFKVLHAHALLNAATDAQLATEWADETYRLILQELGSQEASRFWDGTRPHVDNASFVHSWIEIHYRCLEDLIKRLPFSRLT